MHRRVWTALAALILLCGMTTSCARYAPQTPITPLRKILEITFTTNTPIDPNVYYYIAMDISGNLASDGPHAVLSGAESAKNWSYYIRLYGNQFTELYIPDSTKIDFTPTPFNQSNRYYYEAFSGNSAVVRIYLDKLNNVGRTIWFNFITSAAPVTGTIANVNAIDFLTTPSFNIDSTLNTSISNQTYPQISAHTPPAGYEAADITAWTVRVYEI